MTHSMHGAARCPQGQLPRVGRRLSAALVLGLLLVGMAGGLRAEPNRFEQQRIEAQALETFRRIIALWREEVYFELYDHGIEASRARIGREEFAQRMVELAWVPEGELNPTYLKAQFRFRTAVYISVRMPYRHKFNPERRFAKDQTLLLQQEKGAWKVDLIALIRSPFGGT